MKRTTPKESSPENPPPTPDLARIAVEKSEKLQRTVTQAVGVKQGVSRFSDEHRARVSDILNGIEVPKRKSIPTDRFSDDPTIYAKSRNSRVYKYTDYLNAMLLTKRIDKEQMKEELERCYEICGSKKAGFIPALSLFEAHEIMTADEVKAEIAWFEKHSSSVTGETKEDRPPLFKAHPAGSSFKVPGPEDVDDDEVMVRNWHPQVREDPGNVVNLSKKAAMRRSLERSGQRDDDGDDPFNDPTFGTPREETPPSDRDSDLEEPDRRASSKKRKKLTEKRESKRRRRVRSVDEEATETEAEQAEGMQEAEEAPAEPEQQMVQTTKPIRLIQKYKGYLHSLHDGNSVLTATLSSNNKTVTIRFIPHQTGLDDLPENSVTHQKICQMFSNEYNHVDIFLAQAMFHMPVVQEIAENIGLSNLPQSLPNKIPQFVMDVALVKDNILPVILEEMTTKYPDTELIVEKVATTMTDPDALKNFIRKHGCSRSDFLLEKRQMDHVRELLNPPDSVMRQLKETFVLKGMDAASRKDRTRKVDIMRTLGQLSSVELIELQDKEITELRKAIGMQFFENPRLMRSEIDYVNREWLHHAEIEYGWDEVKFDETATNCKKAKKVYDSLLADREGTLRQFDSTYGMAFQEFLDSLPTNVAAKLREGPAAPDTARSVEEDVPDADLSMEPAPACESVRELNSKLRILPMEALSCKKLVTRTINGMVMKNMMNVKVTALFGRKENQIMLALHSNLSVTKDVLLAGLSKTAKTDMQDLPGLDNAIVGFNIKIRELAADEIRKRGLKQGGAQKGAGDILMQMVASKMITLDNMGKNVWEIPVSTAHYPFKVNAQYLLDLEPEIDAEKINKVCNLIAYFLDKVSRDELLKTERFTLNLIPHEVYVETAEKLAEIARMDPDFCVCIQPVSVTDIVRAAFWVIAEKAGKDNMHKLGKSEKWKVERLFGKRDQTWQVQDDGVVVVDDDEPAEPAPKSVKKVREVQAVPEAAESATAKQSKARNKAGSKGGRQDQAAPEPVPAPAKQSEAEGKAGKGKSKQAQPAPAPAPVAEAASSGTGAKAPSAKHHPRPLNDANKQVLVPIFVRKLNKYLRDRGASMPDEWAESIEKEFYSVLGRPQAKVALPGSVPIISAEHERETIEDAMSVLKLPSVASEYFTAFNKSLDRMSPSARVTSFVIQVAAKIYEGRNLKHEMPACLSLAHFKEMYPQY